ncbi:MAG: tRNA (cytidine(34)-2'-O)-methyltransferase [Alphaproteobacteria bacterium]|nr:tRNA (cytidine(34)-2'-O)-methyltransferase [Alphaproteobacteria bacterium]
MRIALFEPDIAANVGTIIRLGACMAVAIDIIEPCGFPFGDTALKRAGMDYLPRAAVTRHDSWRVFVQARTGRLILATTKTANIYTAFDYRADDTLLFGRESAGVTPEVSATADAHIGIPMAPGMRSLNVAVTAGMILGEALRQTARFPTSKDTQR